MLPKTGEILAQDFKIIQRPSRTSRLDMDGNRIYGQVDGLEAVRQAVYGILNTERYAYVIHSWNYGIELDDLFGRPVSLVKSKIKKRIKEALTQDDRIQGVDAFSFIQEGRRLSVRFTVHTIMGELKTVKEVDI